MRRAASVAAALRRGADRWLFRVGAPEPGPIRLTQRRIYVLPTAAGLGFTIALTVMMIPMLRERPMWVAALVGGLGAVLLRELPLRLGLIAGIALGIVAGFVAERALSGRASR